MQNAQGGGLRLSRSKPAGLRAEKFAMSDAVASSPADAPSATASSAPLITSSSSPASSVPKPRSCVVCRSRKVRCDKQTPCSNCRRANIACVVPSNDRPPRWARRLERLTANVPRVNPPVPLAEDSQPDALLVDRLRNLEALVKELRSQLEQAQTTGSSTAANAAISVDENASRYLNSPTGSGSDATLQTSPSQLGSVQNQFGTLVLQDKANSRYVSSDFWCRVGDQLKGLNMDTNTPDNDDSDSSDDDTTSPGKTPSSTHTYDQNRDPAQRQAFVFGHNLQSSPDIRRLHPLPSQIPYLMEVFVENINFATQLVHVPAVTKIVRDIRAHSISCLTPSNEALLFSIYYAAIASMEHEDVTANFGVSQADLLLQYRLGLEHAWAKADFLHVPDITVVQSLATFLLLGRRYDSPRFIWMMTGLLIRMAQCLGLQRDGSNFKHLSPYEVEMRRRLWTMICMLDLRASEDQGTELSILAGHYDTRGPLNVNDSDLTPEMTEFPPDRQGLTDSSLGCVFHAIIDTQRRIAALGDGEGKSAANLLEKQRLLDEIYSAFDRKYFQYTAGSRDIEYWMYIAKLIVSKMRLVIYLPVVLSRPNDTSLDFQNRLLTSAIELAEYNHVLISDYERRKWRWLYQTYTHWHAIVYLLLETSQRAWSPLVERAWVALHSSWLIPDSTRLDKALPIWVPLRKLMSKARKHRYTELQRLKLNPTAATQLETEYKNMQIQPASPGMTYTQSTLQDFCDQWRYAIAQANNTQVDEFQQQLLPTQAQSQASNIPISYSIDQWAQQSQQPQGARFDPVNTVSDSMAAAPYLVDQEGSSIPWLWTDLESMDVNLPTDVTLTHDNSTNNTGEYLNMDLDMNLDGGVNWHNWLESATGLERGN